MHQQQAEKERTGELLMSMGAALAATATLVSAFPSSKNSGNRPPGGGGGPPRMNNSVMMAGVSLQEEFGGHADSSVGLEKKWRENSPGSRLGFGSDTKKVYEVCLVDSIRRMAGKK